MLAEVTFNARTAVTATKWERESEINTAVKTNAM